MFWRVELDKEGSIKSCDYVPEQGKNGGRVIYVEAETKAQACSSAKAWHERRKRAVRTHNSKRHAAAIAAGKCARCRKADARPGKVSCQSCQDRIVRRAREVRLGLCDPQKKMSPQEAKASYERTMRNWLGRNGVFNCKSSVLINRATELGDNGPLVQWLIAEQERRAAAWRAANPEPKEQDETLPMAAE